MNPEGPLVPQSNIHPEFNTHAVGSKGVRINSPQKNDPIASGVFSLNASTCGAFSEISPHSNSLYFCWSRENHDVLCKPRDQHPISCPGDQYHDQHLFLTGNTHLRPHMTNSGTNFCNSSLIAPVAPSMYLRPSWAIHFFGARPLSVLAGDIPA